MKTPVSAMRAALVTMVIGTTETSTTPFAQSGARYIQAHRNASEVKGKR